jgi:hypothetical protein
LWREYKLACEENLALVLIELPLPRSSGELLAACVRLVPAECLTLSMDNALKDAKMPYVCGVGVNPTLFRYFLEHRDVLCSAEACRGYCLLSIVEKSCLHAGYPNCDVVGAVAHGTLQHGEAPEACVLREMVEESRIKLPAGAIAAGGGGERWRGVGTGLESLARASPQKFERDAPASKHGRAFVKSADVWVLLRVLPDSAIVAVEEGVEIDLGFGPRLTSSVISIGLPDTAAVVGGGAGGTGGGEYGGRQVNDVPGLPMPAAVIRGGGGGGGGGGGSGGGGGGGDGPEINEIISALEKVDLTQ